MRVGVVGAGNISGQYSATLARLPQLQVVAVADLDPERAAALAARHEGARAVSRRSCSPPTTSTWCST